MSSEDEFEVIMNKDDITEEEESQFPPEIKKPLKMGKSILPPPKIGGKSAKKSTMKALRVVPIPEKKKEEVEKKVK